MMAFWSALNVQVATSKSIRHNATAIGTMAVLLLVLWLLRREAAKTA